MAKVFPTLTKNQRQYLGELAAGKRQINVLESLLSNWEGVEKALSAAQTSTGSAMRENEKYLNSIEGKMNAVESAWQKLSTKTVDDNLIKGFYDLLKALIDIQSSFGGLLPLITLAVTLLSSKLVPAVMKAKTAIVSAFTAIKTAGTSAVGLSTAIGGIATVLLGVIGLFNSWKEAQRQAAEASFNNAISISNQMSELQGLNSSYLKLYNTANKTESQERELISISKDLETALGSRKSALEGLTVGTKEYNDELQRQISLDISSKLPDVQKGINGIKKAFEGIEIIDFATTVDPASVESLVSGVVKSYLGAFSEISEYNVAESGIFGIYSAKNIDDATKFLDSIQSAYNDLTLRAIEAKNAGNELLYEQITQDEVYRSLSSALTDYNGTIEGYIQLKSQQLVFEKLLSGEYPKTEKEYLNLRNEIVESTGATGNFMSVVESAVDSLFPQYADAINNISEYTSSYVSKTSEISDKIATLKEELKGTKDVYSILSGAMEEYNSTGNISVETLQKLLSLSPEYLQYLIDENGNISLNKEALDQLTAAKLKDLETSLEAARSSEILDAQEAAREQIYQITQAKKDQTETNELLEEANESLANQVDEINEKYNTQIQLLESVGVSTEDVIDNFESANSSLDEAQSAYKTLSSAIEEYNNSGAVSIDTLQELLALSPQYLQGLFDETGALNVAKASIYAQAEALKIAKIQELQAAAAADVYAYSQGNISQMSPLAQSAIYGIGNAAATTGTGLLNAAAQATQFTDTVLANVARMGGKISGTAYESGAMSIVSAYQSIANSIAGINVSNISNLSGATSGAGSAAQSTANSYEDLVKIVMKMIEQETKNKIDALKEELEAQEELKDAAVESLEAQLSGYKKLISARKESLKKMKEEKDYQDELSEKTKDVSEIQRRLDELEFDTSESGMAEKLRLREELAKKQKDLSDYQFDHSIDLQQDELDAEQDAYEESIQNQINNIEESFELVQQDYENRIQALQDYLEQDGLIRSDAIALIEGKSQDFYNRLFEWNRVYGDMTQQELQNLINSATSAGSSISSAMHGAASSTGCAGRAAGQAALEYDRLTESIRKAIDAANRYNSIQRISEGRFKEQAPLTHSYMSGFSESILAPKHHNGLDSGFVGSSLNGNEQFVKALKGEVFVTPKQQNNFMNNVLPNMLSKLSSGNNIEAQSLLTINVGGSIDEKSIGEVKRAVVNQFQALNKVLSGNGIIRTANNFV